MEGCGGKRTVDRLVVPRKGSSLVLSENMNKKDDKNVPLCSRDCSPKASSTKRSRISSTDNNIKVDRPSISSSSNGKEIVGSSSQTPSRFGCVRKPSQSTTRRPPSCNLDIDLAETISVPSQKTKRGTINVHSQTAVSGEVVMTEVGCSSRGGARRNSHQKSDSSTRDALTGPSVSSSSGNSKHTGLSRNRLRNLRCNSGSDVLPTSSSSPTKITVTKKKSSDGESSSSSKGNKTSVSVPKDGNGITVSDNRQNRIGPTIRDNSVVSSSGWRSSYFGMPRRVGAVRSSVTTLQTPHPETPTDPNPSLSNSYSRPNSSTGRLHSQMPSSPLEAEQYSVNQDDLSSYNMGESSSHGNGITLSDNRRNRIEPTIRDNSLVSSSGRRSSYFGMPGRVGAVRSSVTTLQTPHPETPSDPNPPLPNSYSRPNSNTGRLHIQIPGSPLEAEQYLVNRDGLSSYNMDEIEEVFMDVESMEHDEEDTYQQLASLETNLLSSGMLRFYDQHRDMRLDIDNMSYEELLALGDKMGTVSTALSEEALLRSLKKSIYQETAAISAIKDDDNKCSICQEEYVEEDEVGTLPCQHMYHLSCVQQWLKLKNWCPICKTSAEEKKSV